MTFAILLDRLLDGGRLGEEDAENVMDEVLRGELAPERLAALLVALRSRAPAVDELVGFARATRKHAVQVHAPGPLLDTCGTGGAALKTFNISTCSAFVAAAAGARVAKHGNRSVTRPSGSADVLERAGARLDLDAEACARVLADAGIVFLFAPTFHPAMRHAAPVRKALGVKTVFNLLGPLCNPAGAEHQVLGVYDPDLVPIMAEALGRLGCRRGFVLHGEPGTDEATPCGDILVARVGEEVQGIDPRRLGMQRRHPEEIAPVPPQDAPKLLRDILQGKGSPAQADAVALNAAFALALETDTALEDGLAESRALLAHGSGTAKWDAFIEATRRHA